MSEHSYSISNHIDEIRYHLNRISAEADLTYEKGRDQGYNDAYGDANEEAAETATDEIKGKLFDFIHGNGGYNYGPPVTSKQAHGFITHNGDYFGFGDTAEESFTNYLLQVESAVLNP